MKNKIVWKLTACFAVILLLFSTVLGTVFVSSYRRHMIAVNRKAMEEKAVSVADTVAALGTGKGMGSGMGNGHGGGNGYGAFLRFLSQLVTEEVWIVDENLNLLTSGHKHEEEQELPYEKLPENAERIVERVFEGELIYGEEFSGLLGVPTLTVGAPIMTEEGVFGAVLLHSPVSGVDEAVRQGLLTLLLGGMVALALAGATAVWLSYWFTKPLKRMKAAASFLAEGDYTARTGVKGTDEIGELAQTLDILSGRLLEVEEERAALDKMKEDFVANVSHELRTPVAVLRGSLEVLQDGTIDTPEEISDYYDQMMNESKHLERLVNDLLDLSRLQDVRFKLAMEEVNLCHVVQDAARAIRRPAAGKELEVFVDCPPEECNIKGDYGRIRQLLLIFLDNGVKFSSDKGRIEILLCEKEGRYRLSVSNKGATLTEEEIAHLFDRFYKESSRDNTSGTGLGLAIAKQIAQRHGATILVESRNGKTVFHIEFPHK